MQNHATEMRIGYARVSSEGQDLAPQIAALERAGCNSIRSEKKSGTSLDGRPELKTILEYLRAGDTLVVTRIDRLARSLLDLQRICHMVRDRGAYLRATEQDINTSTPAGKAFFDMLGVFAEFETNLRKERQMEGITLAKKNGVYRGRPVSKRRLEIEPKVRQFYEQGEDVSAIARQFAISRSTVYDILNIHGKKKKMMKGPRDEMSASAQ